MTKPEKNGKAKNRNVFNVMIAAVAGQVGCLTLVIILAAVLGGLALDARLDTKPWFTIGLLLVSIPISLVLMFFIVRTTVSRIRTNHSDETQEEAGIGKNS